MNEQLTVKNFGPITEATVDFKRVTVFIGPTGGGKSTLAKLAAIFRDNEFMDALPKEREIFFRKFSIEKYFKKEAELTWNDKVITFRMGKEYGKKHLKETNSVQEFLNDKVLAGFKATPEFLKIMNDLTSAENSNLNNELKKIIIGRFHKSFMMFFTGSRFQKNTYIPTDRISVPALEYTWTGLLRDDIGLPKILLNFANEFSVAKMQVKKLSIKFLKADYVHRNGQDFIKTLGSSTLLRLYETASGIQSVTPLLVLLEHLSRNTEQAQSFIIEEPELNLYPTAQQGLLNWLVEKCTKGENDLTITTHSPYILSSCNLLLEAYKVAQQRPELADDIDKIVPRACWLNPDEFAAYYVADGTVKPITDARTHLIGGNELDAVSGDISDSFRRLLQLKKQVA